MFDPIWRPVLLRFTVPTHLAVDCIRFFDRDKRLIFLYLGYCQISPNRAVVTLQVVAP